MYQCEKYAKNPITSKKNVKKPNNAPIIKLFVLLINFN